MATEDKMQASVDAYLSDEILEEVFIYLSPIELIIIERVSKRWREISLKSWRNKKKLSVDWDLGLKFPLEHVEKVLRRGGKYLTHLDVFITIAYPHLSADGDFSFKKRPYPEKEIFEAISMYCQKLVFLKMYIDEGVLYPSGKNLQFLEDSVLKNLRSLEMFVGKMFGSSLLEKNLTKFLKKAKMLEEFIITAEYCISGVCLLSLPKTCKKLTVVCGSLDEKNFMKVLGHLPDLESLNIDNEHIKPEVVRKVCHKLETFVVGRNDNFFVGNEYKALSLENVRVFDIGENNVSDVVLLNLIEKLPLLVELSVKRLENVSDEGFRHLGRLEHLKFLNISNNDQISDETLSHLGKSLNNLEKVFCECCGSLTCSGLLSLIDPCKKLKLLQIGSFERTDDFLISALKLVDERPGNFSLTIDVGATVLDDSEFLVPNNDRHLKFNCCKVKGYHIYDMEEWAMSVPVIRYVSSKSITDELE